MSIEHPYIDDIPAYAIGALDRDSRIALEAHMPGCPTCQAELASFRAVSETLLKAIPPVRPPLSLRRQLQNRLPANLVTKQAWWSWSLPQVGMAALIFLLLLLNISSFFQFQNLRSIQAKQSRQLETDRVALAMLAYPETKTVPIHADGLAGTILLDKERSAAVILAWDLPALPSEQSYQIWLIDPQGGRTSAGVFAANAGSAFTSIEVQVTGSLAKYVGLGVTVEPAGGSPQPTGARVFKVDF
jgi:anti-sigma-K factor RskA